MRTILCDWQDNLKQYNLPGQDFEEIRLICNKHKVNFEFLSSMKRRDDVIACVGNKFDETQIANYPKLRWVHFGSVGTDKISSNIAVAEDIVITNASGIFDSAVARHSLSMIFWSLINSAQSLTKFDRECWEGLDTSSWSDIQILILGSGSIAKHLKSIMDKLHLKSIIVHRDRHKGSQLFTHKDRHKYKETKVIIVNLLPTQDNDNFINIDYLKAFKHIISYINVGRNTTENLYDIKKLLRVGVIRRAAWDVIRDQDIYRDLKKEFSDQILLTPHVASFNHEHWKKSMNLLKYNLQCFLNNEIHLMRNLRNG